ncbi:hypothetical protein PCANC_14018 [Puccinia coronata f. sp. avenae]|uniref:Uncharacterized protein n=1 Tax=Puccinia coronata f. sp. avenae TaxID=200324 RepID=A0A2N5UGY5_9BASI|nr:hypothetical protein PCASD_24059 [Puccinia coronata f. sp. avenae]PLW37015.1 hypothetical protein PCANC_14018 [Puccinia coronata f. sp. avenae]PLW45462.1 hypothetical protein PCASD_05952 [Puccinia coronata f. sp. avenae]
MQLQPVQPVLANPDSDGPNIYFLALPNKELSSSFSFNYYGTRLAVSSLDHHIYILPSDPESSKWPEHHSQEQPTSQPNPEPSPGANAMHNRNKTINPGLPDGPRRSRH